MELFKKLSPQEETQFKSYVPTFCLKGFSLNQLNTIHPVIRKELIRILEESLKK